MKQQIKRVSNLTTSVSIKNNIELSVKMINKLAINYYDWASMTFKELIPSILLLEDDERVAYNIIELSKNQKWLLEWVAHRDEAIKRSLNGTFDLLILDRMLGDGEDSIHLIEYLRDQEINMPTIVLSSVGGAFQRSNGYNAGADIYVEKPFVDEELIAAINALMRRHGFKNDEAAIFQFGSLELRLHSRTASWSNKPLNLSPLSFTILEILARQHGQIISRSELWTKAWPNWRADPQKDVMDQAIFRLRKELNITTQNIKIVTKRYRGFMLDINSG